MTVRNDALFDGTSRLIVKNAIHHLLLVVAEILFAALVKAGEWVGVLSHEGVESIEYVTFGFLLATLIALCLTTFARMMIRAYGEVKADAKQVAGDPANASKE